MVNKQSTPERTGRASSDDTDGDDADDERRLALRPDGDERADPAQPELAGRPQHGRLPGAAEARTLAALSTPLVYWYSILHYYTILYYTIDY